MSGEEFQSREKLSADSQWAKKSTPAHSCIAFENALAEKAVGQ